MTFRSISIPFQVNTTIANPIDVFFNPLLSRATSYDVAVGYFSSAWIRDAAGGIAALAAHGGRSRWIISPSLSKEDWELLSGAKTDADRARKLEEITLADITELQRSLEEETRVALAWLIRDEVLSFRIAVPKKGLTGIFHAKIGIFTDESGERVAFSGSYNMTGAARTNWETIDIYLGWDSGEAKRVEARQEQFNQMWEGRDPNLAVYKPSEAVVAQFIEITEHSRRPYMMPGMPLDKLHPLPWVPKYFLDDDGKLRPHQESAIQSWFKENGRGIFQLATGSGKTVTALAAATKLAGFAKTRGSGLVVIVSVPYKHLAEQWGAESRAFGFEPIICYESFDTWASNLQSKLLAMKLGTDDLAFAITVNATFCTERFQAILQTIDTPILFIADEMHNMGGGKLRKLLPESANFRLGLSATPDRHNDDEGTAAIRAYFGKTVAEYNLSQAIADGTLTRYFYHPVLVEFTDEEMGNYVDLSARIARQVARGGDQDDENSALKYLLIERARLIAGAEEKIPALRRLLDERRESNFNLIYCGDGSDDGERSVDRVLRLVGAELGMRTNRFTSAESTEERRDILSKFGSGEVQALVAIRCLDEGVDVPRTETAYILASSMNPRQFIQRRGRVLRKAPGKEFARIFDFIVVPPAGIGLDDASFNVERSLVRRELSRVDEFASSAENSGDALRALRAIRIRLNLLDS